MASAKKNGNGHDEAGGPEGVAGGEELPAGFVNLAARYAQYDPGVDARDIKKNLGKRGAKIRGYILGLLHMPATIPDAESGEFKDWTALCIELTAPCPVKEPDPDNPDRSVERLAPVGERIIMTVTSALESLYERGLQAILDNLDGAQQIQECIIIPQVSKTKAGRALWIFPVFAAGPKTKRESHHIVSLPTARKAKQMGSGAPPSHTPFDETKAAQQ